MEKLSYIDEPEGLTSMWRGIWSILGERMGRPDINVPPCGVGGEMLIEIGKQGRVPLYVPKEVSTPGALPGLLEAIYVGKYFGKAVSIGDRGPVYSYEELKYRNREQQWGWMHTEQASETPKGERGAGLKGVEPMTLNIYMVGLYVNAWMGRCWDLSPRGFTNPSQYCLVGGSVVEGETPLVTTVITATDLVVPRLGIRTGFGTKVGSEEIVGERTVVRV